MKKYYFLFLSLIILLYNCERMYYSYSDFIDSNDYNNPQSFTTPYPVVKPIPTATPGPGGPFSGTQPHNTAMNKSVYSTSSDPPDSHNSLTTPMGFWTNSASDPNPFVYIDLEQEYQISKVVINWSTLYFASKYSIMTKNNSNWIPIDVTGDGFHHEHWFRKLSLQPIKTRYIGIKCLEGPSQPLYSIKEIKVIVK